MIRLVLADKLKRQCRANASVVTFPQNEAFERPRAAALRLVLASGSPRRRELLGALGAAFTVVATDAEEADEPPPAAIADALPAIGLKLGDHPTLRGWRKATAVASQESDSVVIGADTVVVIDGEVLNKPADEEMARAMLRRLAGRTHTVYTGLCVIKRQGGAAAGLWLDLVASEVVLRALDDGAIVAYVATGEPLDKAGAYGVQGLGGQLVREVRGSYTAVVGFPLPAAHRLLTAAGVSGLADPTTTYQRWLQSQGKEPLPWPPTLP